MTDSDRPTSIPAGAKVATAIGAAVKEIIASLAEVACVLVAGYLCLHGKVSSDQILMVFGGALFGPGIARIRGKPGASTLVTLGIGTALVYAAAKKAFLV